MREKEKKNHAPCHFGPEEARRHNLRAGVFGSGRPRIGCHMRDEESGVLKIIVDASDTLRTRNQMRHVAEICLTIVSFEFLA